MSAIPSFSQVVSPASFSGLNSIYTSIPWGVVIVLGIIGVVILAAIWMITGSSGE